MRIAVTHKPRRAHFPVRRVQGQRRNVINIQKAFVPNTGKSLHDGEHIEIAVIVKRLDEFFGIREISTDVSKRYPITPSVYSKAERYVRLGLTGYDSVNVALAEELDGKWLAFDSKAHATITAENRSVDMNENGQVANRQART